MIQQIESTVLAFIIAVNAFVKEYFAPSIAGKFAILGALLIDRNNDGTPDEWQKEDKK